MKPSLVVLVAAATLVTAASAASHLSAAPASSSGVAMSGAGPPETVMYGHIKSLTRKGGRWQMRFDPAVWLHGETARRAALEDNPGDPGGDYYILEEGHRLLTYLIPASAQITVITSISRGPRTTRVTVSELARIVKGESPKLDQYRHYGFWIRVPADTVRSLDQQYQP